MYTQYKAVTSMLFSSIVSIMDRNGEIQNSYRYDPFGRIIQQREQCRNIHKFSGIYGIIANEELQDVYMMRNRHYDAQHGRFLSMDPIGNEIIKVLLVY